MKSKITEITKLLLIAVLILCVLVPFINMLGGITREDFDKIISSPMFVTAIMHSVRTCLTTTAISVTIGFLLAVSIQRSHVKFKGFLNVFLTIPMLIPSISIGTGLIVLFGNKGVIRNLLHLNTSIYGFWGIVIGSVLYSYPVAFLMFSDALKYEDASPYEAAQVLGISKLRRVFVITLPYLTKTIIAAVFSVFTMTVTDYGIPLMIGGKITTLAVMMYQQVIGQLDFTKGSIIGLFLLIPAVIAFTFNAISKRNAKLSFVTKQFDIRKSKARDTAAASFCGLISLGIVCLIVSFIVYSFAERYPRDITPTFRHILFLFDMGGAGYLWNSLKIALIVATLGAFIVFTTAYLTSRVPSLSSHVLHLISMTSLAIPGLVLGLAYVLTFRKSFIYGTLSILILVNLMHFFASPYLMMYNSLGKMNENLENVGYTLGIPRMRIICDVIVPQSRITILEVFSYFFVNSMMTISAVSFLFSYNTKPISMMIGQFEAQMNLECAAVVSIIILIANAIVKYLINLLKKQINKRETVAASAER